jgi:tetratricopeptide (TPR) repeat protein
MYPDDVEYGVSLGFALLALGKTSAALQELEDLRRVSSSTLDSTRVDIALAQVLVDAKQAKRAKNLAQGAVEVAERLQAPLLKAHALFTMASACDELGELDLAQDSLEEARNLFALVHSWNGVLDSYTLMGILAEKGGDEHTSEVIDRFYSYYEEYQQSGDEVGRAIVGINLGSTLTDIGDLDSAIQILEESLLTFESVGAKSQIANIAYVKVNLGAAFQINQEIEKAWYQNKEALRIFQELGVWETLAIPITNLGELLYLTGKLDAAVMMHRAALKIYGNGADQVFTAYDNLMLGKVLLAKGDRDSLEAARREYDHALNAYETNKNTTDLVIQQNHAETKLGLAIIEARLHDYNDARKHAEEARDIALAANDADLAALAQASYVHIILSTPGSDISSVAHDYREFKLSAAESDDLRLSTAAALLNLRLVVRTGNEAPDAAIDSFRNIFEKSAATGHLVYIMEAQQTLDEISGAPEEIKNYLEQLISENSGHWQWMVLESDALLSETRLSGFAHGTVQKTSQPI